MSALETGEVAPCCAAPSVLFKGAGQPWPQPLKVMRRLFRHRVPIHETGARAWTLAGRGDAKAEWGQELTFGRGKNEGHRVADNVE